MCASSVMSSSASLLRSVKVGIRGVEDLAEAGVVVRGRGEEFAFGERLIHARSEIAGRHAEVPQIGQRQREGLQRCGLADELRVPGGRRLDQMAFANEAVGLEGARGPSDLDGRPVGAGGDAGVEDGRIRSWGLSHDDSFLSAVGGTVGEVDGEGGR